MNNLARRAYKCVLHTVVGATVRNHMQLSLKFKCENYKNTASILQIWMETIMLMMMDENAASGSAPLISFLYSRHSDLTRCGSSDKSVWQMAHFHSKAAIGTMAMLLLFPLYILASFPSVHKWSGIKIQSQIYWRMYLSEVRLVKPD